MKNKTISIFMMLVLVSTLFFGFAVTPVFGTPAEITIDDWESYNLGVTSGTGTYGTWETYDSDGDCDGQITTGARSGRCVSFDNAGGHPTNFWYNLTTEFDYISNISIWIEGKDNFDMRYNFYFYNNTDMVLEFYAYGLAYQFNPIDADGTKVGENSAMGEDGWFNITHVSGNLMNYTWDVGGGDINYAEGASHNIGDWTSFNRIYINTSGGLTEFLLDDIIITSDTPPAGEEEGESDSNYERCSYGVSTATNLYAPYHDTYISTFGDITINEVELFVGTGQYTLVNNSKGAYVAYVNGVSIGSPDYFFQDSSTEYILRWEFNGIDVGTYDIVLEFGMIGDSGASYDIEWLNLPVAKFYVDGSTYDYSSGASNFGNGFQDGYSFYTTLPDYGIKYCIYYDSNIPVTDATTIESSCLEDEIHYINHTYTFSANSVGGSSVWSLLNGTFVEMYSGNFHQGFDSQIIPMPYGYGDGTWYFNVSSSNTYSNCSFPVIPTPTGDYFIYPSGGHDRTIGDGWLDILWKAPDGEDVYMLGEYFDAVYGWQSIFNWSVTGTGVLETQSAITSLNNDIWVGTWNIGLYNETTNVRLASTWLTLSVISDTYWFDVREYEDDWKYGWITPGDRAVIDGANGFKCLEFPCGHYMVIERNGTIVFSFDVTEQEDFLDNLIYQFPEAGTYHFYFSVDYDDKTPYDNVVRTVVVRGDSDNDDIPDELDADDEDEEFTPTPILPDLGVTWGMIMGLMIVSFFTLLPLLLTHMTNQKGFNFTIPSIVYVLFAGIGTLISFAFGLFDTWVIFFIIALGIIALGILYLIGQRQQTGG